MQFRLSMLASALSLAFSVPQANAQTAGQSETAQELAPITVTAERTGSFKSNSVQVGTFRDMAPLDVPQTSNVITREVLDAQAATTLFGALRNTAGVTRSQLNGSTYDNISIRGILVENRYNYRLNGSLPVINLVDIPLENKERVEVLKGASSLYYGFVPPSGIVNLVTKRAGKDPVTNFAASANQYGSANVHVDLGRRFGEQQQVGVRVNAGGGREDIGVDHYEGNRAFATAAFDLKATRDLSFKLDLEHYRKNVSEQALIDIPAAVGGVITLPAVPDAKQNLGAAWQKYDANATNLLFRTDYLLSDNWSVLFEAGKARTERDRNLARFRNFNLTTGEGTLNTSFSRGQWWENENYRAELFGRLPGELVTHELSFGYTANERPQDARRALTASGASDNQSQNLYNPRPIAKRSPTTAFGPSPLTIKDRGWYVSDRVLIGEKWQAMVGVRGSRYENVTPTTRYEADEISPSASLMFKPVAGVSVYGSYLEALEESGTAPAGRENEGTVLPPALSKQKEIGVKAEVAQGVLLQAAYFDIKRPSATTTNNVFVMNGLSHYKGIELTASGEVTKQLALVASTVFMNAKLLNAANTATFGKVPENTPERTASLFAEYRLQDVPGLALSGGLYYVGKRAVNDSNQAFIDSYTTLSLGARYTTLVAGKRSTFQAVIDNATDKNYWATAGNGLLGVGAPRTLKVTAKMEF
ncbi:MAG: TonB-dependent siderophore receptor [Oxalobacteraceae bacterium]|nr:TonB-dependent siderophore receptor [Oxalobacteraceae bacterium]